VREILRRGIKDSVGLAVLKRRLAKSNRLPCLKNSALLQAYHELVRQGKIKADPLLARLLQTRPVRSLSGIVNVSVLTKPYPCPGRCLYCPTQTGLPKSYLKGEPAVLRALSHRFDPFKQVSARLAALKATGHETSKIELLILGGTWSALPYGYQKHFVAECFRAANGLRQNGRNLERLQRINERARQRIIGITVETRPDYIDLKEIKRLRSLGVTRVELGVQSLNDAVLRKNHRGHLVDETSRATRLLKDAGLKVCYHLMVNLPGSNLQRDGAMFERLFDDERFQPDFLKIYPCVVVREAPLFRLWQRGRYRPYSDRQLIDLLARGKAKVPPYCRIIRIYRDIPSSVIVAGSQISNLRQVVAQRLREKGQRCLCIRCREAKEKPFRKGGLKLWRQDYSASAGREVFLSFEDQDRRHLYSLLRLRLPGAAVLPILQHSALIREVHTYGRALAIGQKTPRSPQHQSLGKQLMAAAEKIARKEFGYQRMAVIAGVGTRNYYRHLGYRLKNTYLVKKLSSL